jgi:hypothetical protein
MLSGYSRARLLVLITFKVGLCEKDSSGPRISAVQVWRYTSPYGQDLQSPILGCSVLRVSD